MDNQYYTRYIYLLGNLGRRHKNGDGGSLSNLLYTAAQRFAPAFNGDFNASGKERQKNPTRECNTADHLPYAGGDVLVFRIK